MAPPATATPRHTIHDWPTWLLIVVIHGGWLALLLAYPVLPAGLSHLGLVWMAAWHLSLQHELLHGHPTRHAAVNQLFGLFPISVWYPFAIYRDSHLIHHRDAQLTEPGRDPEGNYMTDEAYRQAGPAWRLLHWVLRTALGRLLFGPLLAVWAVWAQLPRALWRRDTTYARAWLVHLLLLALLLGLVQTVAGITPVHYLLGIAYPALGLAMMRSFYEHRPAAIPAHRIVINEAAWPSAVPEQQLPRGAPRAPRAGLVPPTGCLRGRPRRLLAAQRRLSPAGLHRPAVAPWADTGRFAGAPGH